MTVEDPVTSQMESAVYGLRKDYIEERVQIKHLCFHVFCACWGAKGRNPACAGARWDGRERMKRGPRRLLGGGEKLKHK